MQWAYAEGKCRFYLPKKTTFNIGFYMDFVPVKTFITFPTINVRDSTNSTEIFVLSVIVWNSCRLEISFSKLLYSDKIHSLLSFTNCNFIGLQNLSDWADLLFQIISTDGLWTILRGIQKMFVVSWMYAATVKPTGKYNLQVKWIYASTCY